MKFLVALISALLVSFSVYAQTESSGSISTGNLSPPISEYTRSGDANQYGQTGAQGGTFETSVRLRDALTLEQINAGVTLNYSVNVYSDYSNQYVPYCNQTSWDCKDLVSITMAIREDGQIVQSWNSTITLDYGGYRTYSFAQQIGTNTYSNPFAVYSLYGIDAGYCCGMYGPAFSDPSISITYLIIQQTTDMIMKTIEQQALSSATSSSSEITSMMSFTANTADGRTQDVNVEVNQIQGIATISVVDRETSTTEVSRIEVPNIAPQSDSSSSKEQSSATQEVKDAKTKESASAAAAKIVAQIADRYDQSSQATTLAVMTAIGASYKEAELPDQKNWYASSELSEQLNLSDPYDRLFTLAQDKKMDSLINLQYGR